MYRTVALTCFPFMLWAVLAAPGIVPAFAVVLRLGKVERFLFQT